MLSFSHTAQVYPGPNTQKIIDQFNKEHLKETPLTLQEVLTDPAGAAEKLNTIKDPGNKATGIKDYLKSKEEYVKREE